MQPDYNSLSTKPGTHSSPYGPPISPVNSYPSFKAQPRQYHFRKAFLTTLSQLNYPPLSSLLPLYCMIIALYPVYEFSARLPY